MLSELVWDKFDGLSSSSNIAKFVPFVHVLTSLVDSIEEGYIYKPQNLSFCFLNLLIIIIISFYILFIYGFFLFYYLFPSFISFHLTTPIFSLTSFPYGPTHLPFDSKWIPSPSLHFLFPSFFFHSWGFFLLLSLGFFSTDSSIRIQDKYYED